MDDPPFPPYHHPVHLAASGALYRRVAVASQARRHDPIVASLSRPCRVCVASQAIYGLNRAKSAYDGVNFDAVTLGNPPAPR